MIEDLSQWEAAQLLVVAALLGGVIGIDREVKSKAAGLRTHMLVALGAALFMLAPSLIEQSAGGTSEAGVVRADVTRVAAGVVTGVGFLGAGQIFRGNGTVVGLTSAATIWVTAGVGMVVGLGHVVIAGAATVLVLIITGVLGYIEDRWLREALNSGEGADVDQNDPADAR
jgi:putative Mg2+ transporter-C (MgtC) family protein